jgi:uncharacterized protein
MSGAGKPDPGPPAAGDPSMEDILASIRRILSEEEQASHAAPENPAPGPPQDDVLVLEPSMLVSPEPEPRTAQEEPAAPAPPLGVDPTLVAPEAARAAAASVAGLVRTLATERGTQTHAGGPTIEDLVRTELRPILKEWLDLHLPGLVERLVRAEIERVVGRAAP